MFHGKLRPRDTEGLEDLDGAIGHANDVLADALAHADNRIGDELAGRVQGHFAAPRGLGHAHARRLELLIRPQHVLTPTPATEGQHRRVLDEQHDLWTGAGHDGLAQGEAVAQGPGEVPSPQPDGHEWRDRFRCRGHRWTRLTDASSTGTSTLTRVTAIPLFISQSARPPALITRVSGEDCSGVSPMAKTRLLEH